MPQREGTAVEEFATWAEKHPETVKALINAEEQRLTGRIEIHYHQGKAKVIRLVEPEKRVLIHESTDSA